MQSKRAVLRGIAVLGALAMALAAGTAAGAEDPAIAEMDAFIAKQNVDKTNSGWKTRLAKPPRLRFRKGTTYYWNLETTQGSIKVKLMPEVAPMHVSSTIYLTRLGFYDGTAFHRVIPGFMAQGGEPTAARAPTAASSFSPSSRRRT
jgi:hypothetical protein